MKEHAKTLGYDIPTELQEEVRNVGGKFSVFYDIPSAHCDQVKAFMTEIKDKTHMMEVVRMKCANGEQYLIH
ncbi:unnamed protein product [Nippostrongylus brasiliensis]|uniref:3'-phosphate/5'-hydroxy nucleic acid ligase n=1 Tax=Nippostrongylus brasiliensis TaxID=27835 RepID=A0A0N4Y2J3_NIPBR|nr:unnamed protein product [Nippostrongylus brasiliensis]